MSEPFFYATIGLLLLILVPIAVRLDGYADFGNNKYCFSMRLYGKLTLLGGYAQLKPNGIVVHISDKKAIYMKYLQMMSAREKFEIFQGFRMTEFRQILELKSAEGQCNYLAAMLFLVTNSVACSLLKARYPHLSLKNDLLLTESGDTKLTVSAVTVFNFAILIVAIGKKLMEALINWNRERKSTA